MEIRWSYGRLFSTVGFPILVRQHLYIESGPWLCTHASVNLVTMVPGHVICLFMTCLFNIKPLPVPNILSIGSLRTNPIENCTIIYIKIVAHQNASENVNWEMPAIVLRPQCVNSLWPNDAIWRHRSWSTLAQVMACCLMAPSHYLNQCWLIVNKDQ